MLNDPLTQMAADAKREAAAFQRARAHRVYMNVRSRVHGGESLREIRRQYMMRIANLESR